jgi:hypothetical protein
LFAPLPELTEDRQQRRAGVREQVLVAGWVLAVAPARDHARLLELAQANRQRLTRRPGVVTDVAEAMHAEPQFPEDQQRVTLPDDVEGVGDRADPGRIIADSRPSVGSRFVFRTHPASLASAGRSDYRTKWEALTPAARPTRDVHPNLLLTIFAAAAFMTSLDVFIVNVGLPAVGRDGTGPNLHRQRGAPDGPLDRLHHRRLPAGRRPRQLDRRRRVGPELRARMVVGRAAGHYRSVLGARDHTEPEPCHGPRAATAGRRPPMSRAQRRWLMALGVQVDTWELELNGTHVSPPLATRRALPRSRAGLESVAA